MLLLHRVRHRRSHRILRSVFYSFFLAAISAGLVSASLVPPAAAASSHPRAAAHSGQPALLKHRAAALDSRVAAAPVREFKDVPPGHWAYKAVRALTRRKILVVPANGKFSGEEPVTRYELAVALYRLVQSLEPGKAPTSVPNARGGPAAWLARNHYLTDDSPLLREPGDGNVSAGELSDSMAYVADRILLHRASPDELKGD